MKIFEKGNSPLAVQNAGVGQVISSITNDDFPSASFSYHFEQDDRRYSLFPIASFASKFCLEGGSCLVNVISTRVWAAQNDDYLIQSVLIDLFGGDASYFGDGSTLVAKEQDQVKLASVLHLAMLFGWDIDCFFGPPAAQFEIDHDGSISFYLSTSDNEIEKSFQSSTSRCLTQLK